MTLVQFDVGCADYTKTALPTEALFVLVIALIRIRG